MREIINMILDENELVTAILDVAFYIHKLYGPGLLESVYEDLMEYELRKRGFSWSARSLCR